MKTLMNSTSNKIHILALACLVVIGAGTVSCSSDTKLGLPTNVLFAADGHKGGIAGFLYVIDPESGEFAIVGHTVDSEGDAYAISAMTFGPGNVLYGTTGSGPGNWDFGVPTRAPQLVRINPFTGLLTAIGELKDGSSNVYDISGLAFGSDGMLYGVAGDSSPTNSSHLVTIDPLTAEVTDIGGAGGGYGNALVWDADGERMLFSGDTTAPGSSGGTKGKLFSLNLSTAATTEVAIMDGTLRASGTYGYAINNMAYIGETLYGIQTNWDSAAQKLITINTTTGHIEELAILSGGMKALAAP